MENRIIKMKRAKDQTRTKSEFFKIEINVVKKDQRREAKNK